LFSYIRASRAFQAVQTHFSSEGRLDIRRNQVPHPNEVVGG
jgi:hypothetical protein